MMQTLLFLNVVEQKYRLNIKSDNFLDISVCSLTFHVLSDSVQGQEHKVALPGRLRGPGGRWRGSGGGQA